MDGAENALQNSEPQMKCPTYRISVLKRVLRIVVTTFIWPPIVRTFQSRPLHTDDLDAFRLPHPKLAVMPTEWAEPKASEAASLGRDAAEAILADKPLAEYETAARLCLSRYGLSDEPLPSATRRSDHVFNLARVTAPPSTAVTVASVIAAADISN